MPGGYTPQVGRRSSARAKTTTSRHVASPQVESPPDASSPQLSPLNPPAMSPNISSPRATPSPMSHDNITEPPCTTNLPNNASSPQLSPLNQESGPTPTMPGTVPTIPPLDRRLVLLEVTSNSIQPSKLALDLIKQVVYSHFDGPYICWTAAPDTQVDLWWEMFKKRSRWDEIQFPEVLVRKAFSHLGAKNLRAVLKRATRDNKKPSWMKQTIWEQCLKIWEQSEAYKRRSEVNKRNRAISTEKGIPVYRGGSISTTAHKRKLRGDTGVDPTPKATFEKCYRKKDDTFETLGHQTIEKYDKLVEKATQEVGATEESTLIDHNRLWIEAAGGVKKGRIMGMGSEAQSMLQTTNYVHNATPLASIPPDSFQADVRAELSSLKTQLTQGLTNLEIRVNNSVETVRTETRLNSESWEQKLAQLVEVVASIATCIKEKQSS